MKRLLLLVAMVTATGCARSLPDSAYVNAANVKTLREAFQAGKTTGGDAAATTSAEPTGWATFKGVFKVSGAPQPLPLSVTKDTAVCAPGGKAVLSEVWRTDSAGHLRDVVVYLSSPFKSGDAKWEHEAYAAKKDESPEFDQKECIFLSHMFAMRSTQKLKVLNSDAVGHNTKIDGNGKGQSANFTVAANGSETYNPGGASQAPMPVACSIHPWMSAYIMAVDSPLFAVTKEDGSFEIANIPAGVDLEFKVWHEGLKAPTEDITLNGQPAKLAKGKLKIKAEPDSTVELVFDGPAK